MWQTVNKGLNKFWIEEFLDISAKLHHWKMKAEVLPKYIMGPLKLPAGEEVQEWCVLGLQKEATFDV